MTRLIVLFCSCCAFFTMNANAQTYFPNYVSKQNCSLSQQEFNTWFTDGSVSKDGKVWPANSAGFPTNNTKCDFYKWSAQMFLWLTSPSQSYGGGDFVFDSLIFYDVSPEYTINATTKGRKLISNDVGNSFGLRSAKQDEPFTGEVGQAGGSGVLLSQPGTTVSTSSSLVYYGIHVNDVYAAFLKSQATAVTPAKDFPTTISSELPDAIALTMEVKTSWIDAATVSDASQYITIQAEVPNMFLMLITRYGFCRWDNLNRKAWRWLVCISWAPCKGIRRWSGQRWSMSTTRPIIAIPTWIQQEILSHFLPKRVVTGCSVPRQGLRHLQTLNMLML